MELNEENQLVHDSCAHAARDPDADLQSRSILTGGVVAPRLIQDELVRSQDPFDGVDQPVQMSSATYRSPATSTLTRSSTSIGSTTTGSTRRSLSGLPVALPSSSELLSLPFMHARQPILAERGRWADPRVAGNTGVM
jgi:hypothetical protein